MRKHYQANTGISISIVLKNKKSVHIPFSILSNGKSVYSTDNEEIQYGLEHHYRYGDLFRLVAEEDESASKREEEHTGEGMRQKEEEFMKIKVSDLSSAKDYLSERFGISRTTLRRREDILSAAQAHRIEFEGI